MAFFLKSFFVSLFFLVVCTPLALAHSTVYSFKMIDGEKIIIVTYNTPTIQARIPVTYNIRLYELANGKLIPFDRARLQFKDGKRTIGVRDLPLSENIDADTTYIFPKKGVYTFSVQFVKNNKTISQTTFPVAVERGLYENTKPEFFSAQTIIAFVLGLLLMKFVLMNHWIKTQTIRLTKKLLKKFKK